MLNLMELLSDNPYPGRGILLGRSPDNQFAVAAYFIMGRSENSRNRIFVEAEDGIRTQAHDPAKLTDPSLIIYHPVRRVGDRLIVSNGDQTDTIRDALLCGRNFRQALDSRTFEPDAPHYTPRISGLMESDGSFAMSILKSAEGNPHCCCRQFFSYDAPLPGEGRLLHTYAHDGNPLPSFQGEPVRVALDAPTPEQLTAQLWEALDSHNKIALFVQYRNLIQKSSSWIITNKYG